MQSRPRRRNSIAAIVLAAGKGTRMKTRRAKVLHEVCGRPLAYYPVTRALELGADPVVVVVGHQAEEVEATLRAHLPGAPLRFVVQKEQLGTAHAVLTARPALRGFDGEVLILSGDTPLLTVDTLRAVTGKRGRAALSFATMTLENPAGYGRVVHAPHGGPALVVEEKDATPEEKTITEVNAGLYCADAAFLWKTLSRVGSKNAQREFYLTDLVALAAEGPGAAAARVPPVDLDLREDLRTRLGWGPVFALRNLPEEQARAVLRRESDRRGIFLSDDVMDYLLSRFERDLKFLMGLLDRLD